MYSDDKSHSFITYNGRQGKKELGEICKIIILFGSSLKEQQAHWSTVLVTECLRATERKFFIFYGCKKTKHWPKKKKCIWRWWHCTVFWKPISLSKMRETAQEYFLECLLTQSNSQVSPMYLFYSFTHFMALYNRVCVRSV